MARKSTRENDIKYEKAAAEFLDKHLYPMYGAFARAKDKATQLKGIDLKILTKAGTTLLVDEKLKVYNCLNQTLENISFELSFKKGKQLIDGWFVQDNMTQVYAFVNLFGSKLKELKDIKCENIEKAKVLFVGKKSLRSMFDLEKLKLVDQKLRKALGYKPRFQIAPDIWVVRSNQLKEDPVNLVIRRKLLLECKLAKEMVVSI